MLEKMMLWLWQQEVKVQAYLRGWLLQKAVQGAYQTFARRHPRWVNSLFDGYFLQGRASPLLHRYIEATGPPTPTELAALWLEQFRRVRPSARDEVAFVAADFLRDLETELQRYQVHYKPGR